MFGHISRFYPKTILLPAFTRSNKNKIASTIVADGLLHDRDEIPKIGHGVRRRDDGVGDSCFTEVPPLDEVAVETVLDVGESVELRPAEVLVVGAA